MTRKTAFFEEWPWFKFNKLGIALGRNLKFYTSVTKVMQQSTLCRQSDHFMLITINGTPIKWIWWLASFRLVSSNNMECTFSSTSKRKTSIQLINFNNKQNRICAEYTQKNLREAQRHYFIILTLPKIFLTFYHHCIQSPNILFSSFRTTY